ncbi:MAG: hypothetical protein CMH51_05405 [Myxococcales bacterium]|jgi:flavin reductase (DIM6/NTAB) family NADH-FMN oxidoreductase RutF|nr:hypothetical protein [Myxococcales bacterium]
MDQYVDGNVSLREVMSSYPTGVTVVAGSERADTPFGLTVNSFTSLSLSPPLILVCIGQTSTLHDRLIASDNFSVNILAGNQGAVADRFAAEPSGERFEGAAWQVGTLGVPIIDGATAWLECSRYELLKGGDHTILIGRVEHSAVTGRDALVYHRGSLRPSRG